MHKLEETIGYTFKNQELLLTALTHSSYANEKNGKAGDSYERLEFLGDSILGLTAAQFLYAYTPKLPEGRMTKLRAELVCEKALHKVAEELGIGNFMRLGKGEERTGGRTRPSILADMVESLIAAIFLDSDLEHAQKFIMDNVLRDVNITQAQKAVDYKTMLQEEVQKKADQHISYEMMSESGPDHNKTFVFSVSINGIMMGMGKGRSKKEAEQMAAKKALEDLKP